MGFVNWIGQKIIFFKCSVGDILLSYAGRQSDIENDRGVPGHVQNIAGGSVYEYGFPVRSDSVPCKRATKTVKQEKSKA